MVTVSIIVFLSLSIVVQFMNLSMDSIWTKSYLARLKECTWSRFSASVDPWNIESCASTCLLCRATRWRGRRENFHSAWFISKGEGHTGLCSASRKIAFGCGDNQRISTRTALVQLVIGLRRATGNWTPECSPNPLIRTNMMTYVMCCSSYNPYKELK